MNRAFEILTPLGEDALLLYRMHGKEELSRLSEFELDLLSTRNDVPFDRILGKSVTVRVALQDDGIRHFNGYVTRIAQIGMHGRYHLYRATVRPWLWFLTRTATCRIFQDKTIPDIIKSIFDGHPGLVDVTSELTASYKEWDYCVQYRETDFDFVSRLMEHEGIHYYFKHTEGRHTLVLADADSAHAFAIEEAIPFMEPRNGGRVDRDHVAEWAVSRELQSGIYALTDYDFENPSANLQVKSKIKRDHELSEYEIYDYPGHYSEHDAGEQYARTRIEELQTKFERLHGTTNARALGPGYLFELTAHPRPDQNTGYLVVSAEYELQANEYEAIDTPGATYRCKFTALNSRQPFRPERTTRKPIVQGPQTAIVVGASGEDIYTDKFGRVKVHFHWDRLGKRDENSSCWIRVSQNWGGKGWGGMFIPHVSQEVIVEFLEGDPDRPLITGRVYNAQNMPPVELPAGKTQSIIRDHGGNEIVMQGAAGGQQMRLFSPTHNTTVTLGNSYRLFTESDKKDEVGGNHDEQIGGNSSRKVDKDWFEIIVGKHKVEVGGDLLQFFAGATHRNFVGLISTLIGGWKSEIIGGWESKIIGGFQKAMIKGRKTEIISGNTYKIHAGDAREWRNSSTDEKTPAQRLKFGELKAIYGAAKAQVDGNYKMTVANELKQKAKDIFIEGVEKNEKISGKCRTEAATLKWEAKKLLNKAALIELQGGKLDVFDGALKVK